jgi:hypothetical protein
MPRRGRSRWRKANLFTVGELCVIGESRLDKSGPSVCFPGVPMSLRASIINVVIMILPESGRRRVAG